MSKYPSEIDSETELPFVLDNITEIGAEAINSIRSSVLAIERALGANPQGSESTLVERLAQVLNDDGTFKSAALVASGLIALPIENAQIGTSAGIEESKLDLDVPTLLLQNQLNSDHVDILALQEALAIDINNLSKHTLGLFGRHDGYQIDISPLYGTSITTVGAALDFIRRTFLDHKAATTGVEHFASVISYTPSGTGIITATNLQGAVTQMDTGFIEDRRKHNDSEHSDGVSNDGYILFGGQAGTNDAALRPTRYQTASGPDIIKIGHPNAASVKTRGFAPDAITSSANQFDIVVTSGTGGTRTLTIANLDTFALYPAPPILTTRITLEGVVDYINAQAALNSAGGHFPVSAYVSPDGELVLQHNIDQDDCTIMVKGSISSAITALGFSGIADITVGRVETYIYQVNGSPFSSLKIVSQGTLTQAASSTINLGVDVTSTGLGLFPNSLIHVFNHTDPTVDGTYRIISVISPTSVSLSMSLASSGTFDYVIYADCFNLNLTGGSPKVLDLYMDDDQIPTASVRAQVTFGGTVGVKIVELSQDFPAFSAGSLIVTSTSASTRSVTLNDGSVAGQASVFEIGFAGYLRVWAPDNKAYATCLVFNTGVSTGSPVSDTLTTFVSEANDNRTLLGTTHSDSSSIVELPLDRRNIGLVGNSAIGTEFTRGFLERDISNLHINGTVRGFDIVPFTPSTSLIVTLTGGEVYANGHYISKPRSAIRAPAAAGLYNLVLSSRGTFEFYLDTSPSYSFSDIVANKQLCLLAQVTVASGTIPKAVDARFFINNGELKLPLTVDTRDFGAGTFKSLEAAALHQRSPPNDEKSTLAVLSDITSSIGSFPAGKQVIFYGAVTFSGSLSIGDYTVVEIYGIATFSGALTLGAHSRLVLHNKSSFTSITCGDYSSIEFFDNATSIDSISITGTGVELRGTGVRPALTFSNAFTSIVIGGSNAQLSNLTLDRTTDLAYTLVDLESGSDGFYIENCSLRRSYALNEASWATPTKSGIKLLTAGTSVSNATIKNCAFDNFAEAISADVAGISSWDNWLIDSCLIKNCGVGISIENAENCRITNSLISFIGTSHIKFVDTLPVQRNNTIGGNIFELASTTASASVLTCISIGRNVDNLLVTSNIFRDFTKLRSVISIASPAFLPTGLRISNNLITDCNTQDFYVLDLSNVRGDSALTSNSVINHVGKVLYTDDCLVDGNIFSTTYSSSPSTPAIRVINAAVFSNNRITLAGSGQTARFTGSISITTNQISAASIAVDGLAAIGLDMSGNQLDMTSTTAVTSILLDTGGSLVGMHRFSDNIVRVAGTTSGLQLSQGKFKICNNVMLGTPGSVQMIQVGNSSLASGAAYLIDGNLIDSGATSQQAISITPNTVNVSILNNYLLGIGMTAQAILAGASVANTCITNNFLGGSGNGLLIIHSDADPPNFYIGYNKNYTDDIQQGVFAAAVSTGTWTINTSGGSNSYHSTGTVSSLFLSLNGLPIGSQLISVSLTVQASSPTAVFGQLWRRNKGAVISTPTSASFQNLSSGVSTITIVPNAPSTLYIERGTEYFIPITKFNGPTVDLGQVVVKVKY